MTFKTNTFENDFQIEITYGIFSRNYVKRKIVITLWYYFKFHVKLPVNPLFLH